MSVRLEQLRKAHCPIDVTLLGINTSVMPKQPEKAPPPIDVTLLGIIVFLQPETRLCLFLSCLYAVLKYSDIFTLIAP